MGGLAGCVNVIVETHARYSAGISNEEAQQVVAQIYIDDKIGQYIVDIVDATRHPENCGLPDLAGLISVGGSPRASIGLALAARSFAFLKGRG